MFERHIHVYLFTYRPDLSLLLLQSVIQSNVRPASFVNINTSSAQEIDTSQKKHKKHSFIDPSQFACFVVLNSN